MKTKREIMRFFVTFMINVCIVQCNKKKKKKKKDLQYFDSSRIFRIMKNKYEIQANIFDSI